MRSNKGRAASRQSTGASGLEMWAAAELNSKCKRKAQSLTNNAALMDLFVLLMNASSIEITLGNALETWYSASWPEAQIFRPAHRYNLSNVLEPAIPPLGARQ